MLSYSKKNTSRECEIVYAASKREVAIIRQRLKKVSLSVNRSVCSMNL
jgi:hypothetical protein